jgi:chromosome segregation ATPase
LDSLIGSVDRDMVYRKSGKDPRQVKLEAMVAAEGQLKDALLRAQSAHDTLEAETDSLGRKLAALDREIERLEGGGPISRLAGFLRLSHGRLESKRQKRHSLQSELEQSRAALAELVAEETQVADKLKEIPGVRIKLAELESQRVAALAATEGPRGDELRALAAAIEAHCETTWFLEGLLAKAERTASALADLLDGQRDLDKHPSGGWALLNAAADQSTSVYKERESLVARVQEQLPFVHELLGDLLNALEIGRGELAEANLSLAPLLEVVARLKTLWQAPQADPSESGRGLSQAMAALSDVDSIVSTLSAMHRQVAQEQQVLETRREHAARV